MSLGTPDPYEAARRAVAWVQELQRSARVFKEQEEAERHHALETYWGRWYARETSKRKTQRNLSSLEHGHVPQVGSETSWVNSPKKHFELGRQTLGKLSGYMVLIPHRDFPVSNIKREYS